MHDIAYGNYVIIGFRALIEFNLPYALATAGIPAEDHASIIERVLGRLPSSSTASDGKGLDPALVVGLGLLYVPHRNNKDLLLPPMGKMGRKAYMQVAFNDYTRSTDEHLSAESAELTEALELVMVTRSIGGDEAVGIGGLLGQIDVFRSRRSRR